MGIYLRRRMYWARWTEDGKLRRESLGTRDRAEAERRFRERTGRALPERATQRDSSRRRRGITMSQVLAQWLKYQTPRSKPQSLHAYQLVSKRFTAAWGELEPGEITTQRVERMQTAMLGIGLNPRTINHQIGLALSAIKWAHERDLTDAQPPKVKRLKLRNTRTRKYLSESEIERLLKTVREPKWKRLEVAVMLSLYAGLRKGEITWLTWDDVDLEGGWVHIRSKKGWSPKSSSSERSVPLAEDLARFLRSLTRNSRWVAEQSPGVQWCSRHFGIQCRKLFRAAGVDDKGPHTLHRLRGTFATQVLRSGGDLESLREILGHSVLSVTAGYLSATSESKRRAVGGVRFGK